MKNTKIYKCGKENMVVEVLSEQECCTLFCCGEEMTLMKENSVDAATEKHVPILTDSDSGGVKVTVGSVLHPMTKDHYIQWIEVINGPWVNRKYLQPGDEPMAEFYVPNNGHWEVRAYCNLHGLWKG